MTSTKNRKLRYFLLALLLLAASVVFALGLTEAGMRVYAHFQPEFLERFSVELNTSSPTQYDPQLAYKYKPNSSYWYIRSRNFANKVHINNRGFHDRDFKEKKPVDTYRIVVVGDSYVACQEVPLEKNWMHVLENRLNQSSNKKVQIYSLGVHGYSNSDLKDLVLFEALELEMDMLLYVHFINDIHDDNSYKTYRHSYKNVEFAFNRPSQMERFENHIDTLKFLNFRKYVAFMFYNFYFVRPAVSMLMNRFSDWGISKEWHTINLNPSKFNEAVDTPSNGIDLPTRAVGNILEISNALKERNIHFGFVWLNVPHTGAPWVLGPHQEFKTRIQGLNPPPFDFTIETEKFLLDLHEKEGIKYRFPEDPHFSEFGNRVFAEFIHNTLKNKI